MKKLLSFSIAALGLAMTGAPAADLKPGDPAPDWKMLGSDGKTYQLSDFKGKKAVVVAWFPKALTGGCTKECKSLRDNGDAIRKFEVAYFAASCDQPELNKKFADQLTVDYPILSDPERRAAKAYGLVDGDRKNARRHTIYVGRDGNILHIDDEVSVADHGAAIAAKLAELKVAKKAE